MTPIISRIPRIDWKQGFDRHWHGGNPAVTHAFNALSFLFPQGEKFFIDVAREVVTAIDPLMNPELKKAVDGFIAQELTHHYHHNQYNKTLEAQGYTNVVQNFIVHLQEQSHRNFSSLTKLAIVTAYEHYTAILGNYILRNPRVLASAQRNMALIWGWHSAEETEHKAVCFDLYYAAGGGWGRRVTMFVLATVNFHLMFARLYLSLLWRDDCLKPRRVFRTAGQSLWFFFGTTGVGWYILRDGLRYIAPGFHPWNQDNHNELEAWIEANRSQLRETTGRI